MDGMLAKGRKDGWSSAQSTVIVGLSAGGSELGPGIKDL